MQVEENTFSSLNVGDIIWARRYTNEEEKNKLEPGHFESPFIIIKKTKQKLYGVLCTSKAHKDCRIKHWYYPLGRFTYHLSKNSFVSLRNMSQIVENQFIRKIGCLAKEDLYAIRKYFTILMRTNRIQCTLLKKKDLHYTYSSGDVIIWNHKKYYIYYKGKKSFFTFRVVVNPKMSNNPIHRNQYHFYFKEKKEISRKEEITLADTFHKGEVEFIEEERNVVDPVQNKVGMLIRYKDKVYYVYDSGKKYFHTFLVYFGHEKTKSMEMLFIKKGQFFTDFEQKQISHRAKYKILRRASDFEIGYNAKLFAMSKTKRKQARQNMLSKEQGYEDKLFFFKPMLIVTYLVNKKQYVILSKKDNVLELVNINYCGDYFTYSLEENIPFCYYDIMNKNEFTKYVKQVEKMK